MHKKFIKALTWNSSTAFLYKAILLLHQIMLYSVISKTLYGIQSTLFAYIYVIIALTNFGFEDTLLPFFSTFSKNKQQFLQILYHFTLRIIAVAIISVIVYGIMFIAPGQFLQNIRLYCDNRLAIIFALIFFVESIKKSANAMMQLAFLNKQIAFAELGMLISYIAIIWGIYFSTNSISLFTIFAPMFITASCELMYLSYALFQYYNQLPSITVEPVRIPFILIFKQRIYNYIHQVTKTIFSPNSMTLLFTYMLGFQQAATIKFFTNVITLGYTCIHKTIGVTSGATLSAMHHTSFNQIQLIFAKITKTYFQFLYSMGIMVAIIIGYSWYTTAITPLMIAQITFFLIIGFLENITLTYEQLFISQHRSKILAIINLCELGLLAPIVYWGVFTHKGLFVLMAFILIKLTFLYVITFLAQRYWRIQPIVHKNIYILMISACIAIMSFILIYFFKM